MIYPPERYLSTIAAGDVTRGQRCMQDLPPRLRVSRLTGEVQDDPVTLSGKIKPSSTSLVLPISVGDR